MSIEQPGEPHPEMGLKGPEGGTDRQKLNSGDMRKITEVFDARIGRFQEADLTPDSNGKTWDRFEQKVWDVFPERDGAITDLKGGATKHLCGVSD